MFRSQNNFFFEDLQASLIQSIEDSIVYKENDCIQNNICDLLIDKIKDNYPERIESTYNLYCRAKDVKRYIKKYLETQYIPENHKVIVLSHYSFFMMYTADFNDDEIGEHMKDPEDIAHFKNCKFFEDHTDYSTIE